MNTELTELIPALILFCFISTITPGPNNILLAHSGANFGMRKTLPHVVGIRCGMTLLHIIILLGLGKIFNLWPYMHKALTFIAAGYIVYMSLKIALAKIHTTNNALLPMGTIQAACFQIINPKSWATLFTISSAFTLSGDLFWPSALIGILAGNIATLPGTFMWITIGKLVSKKLQQPKFHKRFNFTMGALLLGTLPMMFI